MFISVSSVLKEPENARNCLNQNQWFFLLKVDGNKSRQWCSVLLAIDYLYNLQVTLKHTKNVKDIIMQEH